MRGRLAVSAPLRQSPRHQGLRGQHIATARFLSPAEAGLHFGSSSLFPRLKAGATDLMQPSAASGRRGVSSNVLVIGSQAYPCQSVRDSSLGEGVQQELRGRRMAIARLLSPAEAGFHFGATSLFPRLKAGATDLTQPLAASGCRGVLSNVLVIGSQAYPCQSMRAKPVGENVHQGVSSAFSPVVFGRRRCRRRMRVALQVGTNTFMNRARENGCSPRTIDVIR